jgi:hypothetical protein
MVRNKTIDINALEPSSILTALKGMSPQEQARNYGTSGLGLIKRGLARQSQKEEEALGMKMLEERAGYGGKNQTQSSPTSSSTPSNNQVQGSFNRMMNIGQVGGLGGRMGELEKASMRFGEAASQRRIGEMEKEIEAKTAGIGAASTASEKASLDSERRALQSKISPTLQERQRLDQINRQLGMLG